MDKSSQKPTQDKRHRTSVRQLFQEIYPKMLVSANQAGLVTIGWSLGTPYGRGIFLRDGEFNLNEGWATTHDAKVGLEAMTIAFRLMAQTNSKQ